MVFVYFSVDILTQQLQMVSNYAIMSLKPFIIFLKGFALNVNTTIVNYSYHFNFKTAKSVLLWLTVSKSFCNLTKLKTTFVNKLKHISSLFNLFVYFHYLETNRSHRLYRCLSGWISFGGTGCSNTEMFKSNQSLFT